jgi:SAM-dependent methyltransferase
VKELLGPVFDDKRGLEVGWPDDEVDVAVLDPQRLRDAMQTVLAEFQKVWAGARLVVDVDVSIAHGRLDVRVTRVTPCSDPLPVAELEKRAAGPRHALDRVLPSLRKEAVSSGGSAERGCDGSYFDLHLQVRAVGTLIGRREHFPSLVQSSWEDHYRQKLERTSWSQLRDAAYRFSSLAIRIADWAVRANAKRVLVPSNGLCVDPWLFADRGLTVIATDISSTALETVRHPERLPQMYGREAKARWEIGESAMYGGSHPASFEGMPNLADPDVVAALGARLEWIEADWTAVPIEDESIDVVFATNALPRNEIEERRRVVREWARVVRPGRPRLFGDAQSPR